MFAPCLAEFSLLKQPSQNQSLLTPNRRARCDLPGHDRKGALFVGRAGDILALCQAFRRRLRESRRRFALRPTVGHGPQETWVLPRALRVALFLRLLSRNDRRAARLPYSALRCVCGQRSFRRGADHDGNGAERDDRRNGTAAASDERGLAVVTGRPELHL